MNTDKHRWGTGKEQIIVSKLVHQLVSGCRPGLTGEGAGQHTRGRVCSPMQLHGFGLVSTINKKP